MSNITPGINFVRFNDVTLEVSGRNPPNPVSTFQEMGFKQFVLERLKNVGFTNPTPVQKHAIPIIMAGRDLIARSETGSGKTAAYLLPIIHKLLVKFVRAKVYPQESKEGEVMVAEPQVVILVPTREVAQQVKADADRLTKGSVLVNLILYGGVPGEGQRAKASTGAHILVATPGRLREFIRDGLISFASIRFLVVDEADGMLQNDFKPVIMKMVNHKTMVPKKKRQTLMFSAISPRVIQIVAKQCMTDYICIGTSDFCPPDIEQVILPVEQSTKLAKLLEVLKTNEPQPTLVFVALKSDISVVMMYLKANDIQADSMSASLSQVQREKALRNFCSQKFPVLVTSDVAARGLNIKGLAHVINYDMPLNIAVYMYRIGRVGRLGHPGLATSLFVDGAKFDSMLARNLVDALAKCEQTVPEFLMKYKKGAQENASAARRMAANLNRAPRRKKKAQPAARNVAPKDPKPAVAPVKKTPPMVASVKIVV